MMKYFQSKTQLSVAGYVQSMDTTWNPCIEWSVTCGKFQVGVALSFFIVEHTKWLISKVPQRQVLAHVDKEDR
jgi:roadblock/LC7 domain-containing protein